MRGLVSITGVLIALSFGGGQALAFQEMPAPPPADAAAVASKPKPQHDPLRLGTPGNAEAPQSNGGLKLFGYTVMPKLNFGLDVLYGRDRQQLQLNGSSPTEEDGDLSVLGKVKRRF